ncbi:hypothetical protein B0H19DRAFT_1246075 [Mycena capillaripes]|nr:hypothetical protein B0H19DRAFT_1246075 [Mycena capillaripes]
MLTIFFTRLTLPFLTNLRIVHHKHQAFPLFWPHLEFLAISHRSSFRNHLKSLKLESVFITEDQLFHTLSELPLLEELVISDHRIGNGDELVLVTDSLLQHFTWTPDPPGLVPNLSFLEMHTLLKFDDTIFRDFVLSRVKPGRNAEGPFEVDLRWYPECRELDPVMVAHFEELQAQGELLFSSNESTLFSTMDVDP